MSFSQVILSQPLRNPNEFTNWDPRIAGYRPPNAPTPTPDPVNYPGTSSFNTNGKLLQRSAFSFSFLALLFSLIVLGVGFYYRSLWYKIDNREIVTNFNITLNGNLPSILEYSPSLEDGYHNITAINFANDANQAFSRNAAIRVYNPSENGFRYQDDGIMEIFTAYNNDLKSAMVIDQFQRIGMGIRNPRTTLDVVGNISFTGYIQIDNTTNIITQSYPNLLSLGNQHKLNTEILGQNYITLKVKDDKNPILNTTNHGIIAIRRLFSSTGFSVMSDERIQEHVSPIDPKKALQSILAITPLKYDIVDKFADATKQDRTGIISGISGQQLEDIIPSAVSSKLNLNLGPGLDYPKMRTIDYEQLVPYLIAAIQQLDYRIKSCGC